MEFALGQRWVSHSEPELGLGVVTEIDGRLITLDFPAVGESRTYSTDQAPLARVEFRPGEQIQTVDEQSFEVAEVRRQQGRLVYVVRAAEGNLEIIDERILSSQVELTSARRRLINGQIDDARDFALRYETLNHLQRLTESKVRGLLGSRTELLPHQLYVAHEVARRFSPRVLLADEVGLGKTIEAGLILHFQLLLGLAQRVLILVPDTLIHQWLVEMLRRFNLKFALFNQARTDALLESEFNPFETEQLIICGLNHLCGNPVLRAAALSTRWDILVVDEAHHLHWQETADLDSSVEYVNEYQYVEALANRSHGLLLLTATPEQSGINSHFARLRLLDPARFYDYDAFLNEQRGYKQLNALLEKIIEEQQPPNETLLSSISKFLGEPGLLDSSNQGASVEEWVAMLLDRHGTGRVFFRNTRATVKGFPKRKLLDYSLPLPDLYVEAGLSARLYPEIAVQAERWLAEDPRVVWLIEKLKQLSPEKVLVICAKAVTAKTLERHLHLRIGIRSTAFVEDLSIVERDRAAAYFADTEAGAQVLICSEIGSEGRNFQFAHQLVLFDLPDNPDLMEQRIGRLDRIGQRELITIHVPYILGSSQAVLFHWYHQGLNIFRESCACAYGVYEKFLQPLNDAMGNPAADYSSLIEATADYASTRKEELEKGRDRLIERHSCNLSVAQELIQSIQKEETPELVRDYFGRLLEVYGVDYEEHSDRAWILRPSDHMRTEYFPELGDESTTVTFDRETALIREDMEFLSWEHPMLAESMAMLLESELGNAAVVSLGLPNAQPGTLLLEAVFALRFQAPKELHLSSLLRLSPLRVLVDINGKDLSAILSHEQLNERAKPVKRQTAQALVREVREALDPLIQHAIDQSEGALEGVQIAVSREINHRLQSEIDRLRQLRVHNKSIREEEVSHFENQLGLSLKVVANSTYDLQALRLIVITAT